MLTALAIDANRVVSIDRLTGEIWGESPPVAPASRVRMLVSEVRRTLGTIGAQVIATGHGGYLLHSQHVELDVDVFEALTKKADLARAQGRAEAAIALLDDALFLWRGAPLTDVRGPLAVSVTRRLLEARRTAIETRAEIKLSRGRHYEVIVEMTDLVTEHPLSERPHALLMLALHRCGRSAEAQQTYQELHRRFVTELGVEPSARLRDLHRRLLVDEPVPVTAEWTTERRLRHRECQLPPDIDDFVGRSLEIQQIKAALE